MTKNAGAFDFQAAYVALACSEFQGRLSNPKEPNFQAGVIADRAWDAAVTMRRKWDNSDPEMTNAEMSAAAEAEAAKKAADEKTAAEKKAAEVEKHGQKHAHAGA